MSRIQTISLLFFLLFSFSHATMIQNYDNIIIGAGIAGIGASVTFTSGNAQHLILEARNRIGGRIAPLQFAGTLQDMGASYVQYPNNNDGINLINPIVEKFGIAKIPGNFDTETDFYPTSNLCTTTSLKTAESVYSALMNYIDNQCNNVMNVDAPVTTLISKFWKLYPNYVGTFTYDRVQQELQADAVDNGADLNQMSSWQWDEANDGSDAWDYAPQGGYFALASEIFNKMCSPILHLSEIVQKIDYSGSNIVVTTSITQYTTNKLLVSLPLGVLKAGKVVFNPPLPQNKISAINGIGNGVFCKLFVTFQTAFWPQNGSRMLYFIGKGNVSLFDEAWVVPPLANSGGQNMLIFFLNSDRCVSFDAMTSQQLSAQLVSTLSLYTTVKVAVTNIYITSWQNDPYTLGSYSYAAVGTNTKMFKNLQAVLQSGNNNIWFIGEHVDPEQYSYSHGAYKTGVAAATAALAS